MSERKIERGVGYGCRESKQEREAFEERSRGLARVGMRRLKSERRLKRGRGTSKSERLMNMNIEKQ